jgi:hypothetical protein
VAAWQRRTAKRLGVTQARTGSITFSQYFGSALQVTPHFHTLVPDGVWQDLSDGVRFVELPPPTTDEVERLLAKVARQTLKRLKARGGLRPDDEVDAQAGRRLRR